MDALSHNIIYGQPLSGGISDNASHFTKYVLAMFIKYVYFLKFSGTFRKTSQIPMQVCKMISSMLEILKTWTFLDTRVGGRFELVGQWGKRIFICFIGLTFLAVQDPTRNVRYTPPPNKLSIPLVAILQEKYEISRAASFTTQRRRNIYGGTWIFF